MKFKLQFKSLIVFILVFFCVKASINNKLIKQRPNLKLKNNDQSEYERLSVECNKIVEEITSMGGSLSSPIVGCRIASYLKGVGTKVALRVLKEQVLAGRVSASYLKKTIIKNQVKNNSMKKFTKRKVNSRFNKRFNNYQREYEKLSFQCNKIVEEFTSMGSGALSSPVLGCRIASYLKGVGTKVALRVLKEQVLAGRVSASYLN